MLQRGSKKIWLTLASFWTVLKAQLRRDPATGKTRNVPQTQLSRLCGESLLQRREHHRPRQATQASDIHSGKSSGPKVLSIEHFLAAEKQWNLCHRISFSPWHLTREGCFSLSKLLAFFERRLKILWRLSNLFTPLGVNLTLTIPLTPSQSCSYSNYPLLSITRTSKLFLWPCDWTNKQVFFFFKDKKRDRRRERV